MIKALCIHAVFLVVSALALRQIGEASLVARVINGQKVYNRSITVECTEADDPNTPIPFQYTKGNVTSVVYFKCGQPIIEYGRVLVGYVKRKSHLLVYHLCNIPTIENNTNAEFANNSNITTVSTAESNRRRLMSIPDTANEWFNKAESATTWNHGPTDGGSGVLASVGLTGVSLGYQSATPRGLTITNVCVGLACSLNLDLPVKSIMDSVNQQLGVYKDSLNTLVNNMSHWIDSNTQQFSTINQQTAHTLEALQQEKAVIGDLSTRLDNFSSFVNATFWHQADEFIAIDVKLNTFGAAFTNVESELSALANASAAAFVLVGSTLQDMKARQVIDSQTAEQRIQLVSQGLQRMGSSVNNIFDKTVMRHALLPRIQADMENLRLQGFFPWTEDAGNPPAPLASPADPRRFSVAESYRILSIQSGSQRMTSMATPLGRAYVHHISFEYETAFFLEEAQSLLTWAGFLTFLGNGCNTTSYTDDFGCNSVIRVQTQTCILRANVTDALWIDTSGLDSSVCATGPSDVLSPTAVKIYKRFQDFFDNYLKIELCGITPELWSAIPGTSGPNHHYRLFNDRRQSRGVFFYNTEACLNANISSISAVIGPDPSVGVGGLNIIHGVFALLTLSLNRMHDQLMNAEGDVLGRLPTGLTTTPMYLARNPGGDDYGECVDYGLMTVSTDWLPIFVYNKAQTDIVFTALAADNSTNLYTDVNPAVTFDKIWQDQIVTVGLASGQIDPDTGDTVVYDVASTDISLSPYPTARAGKVTYLISSNDDFVVHGAGFNITDWIKANGVTYDHFAGPNSPYTYRAVLAAKPNFSNGTSWQGTTYPGCTRPGSPESPVCILLNTGSVQEDPFTFTGVTSGMVIRPLVYRYPVTAFAPDGDYAQLIGSTCPEISGATPIFNTGYDLGVLNTDDVNTVTARLVYSYIPPCPLSSSPPVTRDFQIAPSSSVNNIRIPVCGTSNITFHFLRIAADGTDEPCNNTSILNMADVLTTIPGFQGAADAGYVLRTSVAVADSSSLNIAGVVLAQNQLQLDSIRNQVTMFVENGIIPSAASITRLRDLAASITNQSLVDIRAIAATRNVTVGGWYPAAQAAYAQSIAGILNQTAYDNAVLQFDLHVLEALQNLSTGGVATLNLTSAAAKASLDNWAKQSALLETLIVKQLNLLTQGGAFNANNESLWDKIKSWLGVVAIGAIIIGAVCLLFLCWGPISGVVKGGASAVSAPMKAIQSKVDEKAMKAQAEADARAEVAARAHTESVARVADAQRQAGAATQATPTENPSSQVQGRQMWRLDDEEEFERSMRRQEARPLLHGVL